MLKLAKLNGSPEIFFTIQGEGGNIGLPSIFVRTALCNLYCVWCDTDYTWNWEGTPFTHRNNVKYRKEDYIVEISTLAVAQAVQQWPCKNIVLSGGEPMLQQKELAQLMELLSPGGHHYAQGYHFEVETNATVAILPEFDAKVDQYNCSPKLASSGNKQEHRETRFFQQYAQNPKATFKFVICTPEDLREMLAFIEKHDISRNKVLVMPEGRTLEELNSKALWLVEQAKNEGLRYTPRLHINLWGAKRGV